MSFRYILSILLHLIFTSKYFFLQVHILYCSTITLCIFFMCLFKFYSQKKTTVHIDSKKTDCIAFQKPSHTDALSASFFLLFDSSSHIVGFLFVFLFFCFLFLVRHLELFVSVGNESVFLTHKYLKSSYFRKMTE